MKQIILNEIFPYIFGAGLFYLALQLSGLILFIGLIMIIPAIKSIRYKKKIKMGYKLYRGI